MLDHLYQGPGRVNHGNIRYYSRAQTPFSLGVRIIRCHFPGYSVMYLRSTLHPPLSLQLLCMLVVLPLLVLLGLG